ncbi:MAG TPA: site-specific integrase [Longimicrobiales bacterium]|nr:site-specific integrase [Longimicrobiales bacterium]
MGGDPSRVEVVGPLVPYVTGFRKELEFQGYRRNAVADQLRVMAHVSRWLASEGLSESNLTPERVEQFLAARRAGGYVLWLSPKGVGPLLAYLRSLGVAPVAEVTTPRTPAEQVLERYRSYLLEERGLAAGTVRGYLDVAGLFLKTQPPVPGLELDELTASEIIEFVVAECRHRSTASARHVVNGLRALLRYCYLEGITAPPLAEAVPAVAGWRLSTLPRAIEPVEVAALLRSCDRRTMFGRRDFAVLSMLVRLGLRVGEVAGLLLHDIDWRSGEFLVRGKGPKEQRLPLPTDVGEAIAGWLRWGRPRCAAREVFTRVRAPHQGLTSAGVSAIVTSAAKRAGLDGVHAHRLRHTAATEMLRSGAGLQEIGQVLRHQSVLTTSIYAKLDRSALRELAKPWPTEEGGEVAS